MLIAYHSTCAVSSYTVVFVFDHVTFPFCLLLILILSFAVCLFFVAAVKTRESVLFIVGLCGAEG